MHIITTAGAPKPAGHYSQAVVHGGLVYVAGQLPIRKGKPQSDASAEAQTVLTLRNVEAILEAAGSGLDHVLKMTVYVPDVALWADINAAYARVMGDHKPARVVVPTRDLHHGVLVEIDAIAAVRETPSGGRKTKAKARSAKGAKSSFTATQGRYLAFIHSYTQLHGQAPAEADMVAFFRVTPPSVHNMVMALEKRGLISRTPRVARSIQLLVDPALLPELG